MVHVLDTRHGTCIQNIQGMEQVFNTRHDLRTQYKAWYMYSIHGMVHAFDTRHATCIQYDA